ncbi:MAG: DUF368 domain-containing protein, partial [Anaerolineales bacterium]|nr:DUF368 domain-containing protein [Anaerolineales bacterium]
MTIKVAYGRFQMHDLFPACDIILRFDTFKRINSIVREKHMQKTAAKATPAEEKKQRTIKEYVGLVLRGMAMGASDIVPGVSGGTMAFILGIYEELINSIRTIGQPEFIQAVLKFRVKDIFRILNWQFLIAVAAGIIISLLTLSKGL